MTLFTRGLGAAVFALAALAGCGGGDTPATATTNVANVTPVAAAPLIQGAIVNLQDSAGGQVYFAFINVASVSASGNTDITSASVTINGISLARDTSVDGPGGYLAIVAPDGAGNFNLSVSANGASYAAVDTAVTAAFPIVSLPTPFRANTANTVSWTPPPGAPANMGYQFDITELSGDVRLPVAGSLTAGMPLPASNVSVSVLFSSDPLTTTSVAVPANRLVAGVRYEPNLTVVWPSLVSIPNAATGSALLKSTIVNAAIFTAQ